MRGGARREGGGRAGCGTLDSHCSLSDCTGYGKHGKHLLLLRFDWHSCVQLPHFFVQGSQKQNASGGENQPQQLTRHSWSPAQALVGTPLTHCAGAHSHTNALLQMLSRPLAHPVPCRVRSKVRSWQH
jgi:hypothetical protein